MSNQTEIRIILPNKLIKQLDEYCAVTKKSLNEIIESELESFAEENDDLLCVEWSTLSDKFNLDYETQMDIRQLYFDTMNTIGENRTDDQIMKQMKEAFESRGIDSSEEFIRFIGLDLLFE